MTALCSTLTCHPSLQHGPISPHHPDERTANTQRCLRQTPWSRTSKLQPQSRTSSMNYRSSGIGRYYQFPYFPILCVVQNNAAIPSTSIDSFDWRTTSQSFSHGEEMYSENKAIESSTASWAGMCIHLRLYWSMRWGLGLKPATEVFRMILTAISNSKILVMPSPSFTRIGFHATKKLPHPIPHTPTVGYGYTRSIIFFLRKLPWRFVWGRRRLR